MAEMAAKAHEISLEAGSRMAGTMREVVGAAAGLTPFAIESARDLVQYMVRRGQMSQDEADKLMREVDAAHATSPRPLLKVEPKSDTPKKAAAAAVSAITPAPQIAINVEPPVVPRPLRSIATDALDEEDEESFGDPDADTSDFDEEPDTAPVSKSAAAAVKAPTPPKAAPAKAPHPPAQKTAAKPPVAKAAAKPATKSAVKPAPKVAAKAAPKNAVKVAAKPPAKKSAPPKKK